MTVSGTAGAATSASTEVTSVHATEASAKSMPPILSGNLRPKRSLSGP